MKEGLSGFVFAKNAIKLDYCLELAARSLLPVVDELILCDSNSTDGTTELMHSIQGARVINYDVPNPVNHPLWCPEWRNFVREKCQHKMHITLDADEVLDNSAECHAEVKKANDITAGKLLIFFKDEKTLLPIDYCHTEFAIRIAPTYSHCQYGDPYHYLLPDKQSKDNPRIKIFHLGLLRHKNAFYEKCTVIHPAHNGSVDPRLEQGNKEGKKVHEIDWGWKQPLREYNGSYPPGVLEWIKERTR